MQETFKRDRDYYAKAMVSGASNVCIYIESKHGLAGYPPEIVSAALAAGAEGRDIWEEIDSILVS